MNVIHFPPRRKRRWFIEHAMILSVATLTLAGFAVSTDEEKGKAKVTDALGFTLIFTAASYYTAWLPAIWGRGERNAFESVTMPVLIAIVTAYLYFVFRSYYVQPGATVMSVLAQLVVLIVVACRME